MGLRFTDSGSWPVTLQLDGQMRRNEVVHTAARQATAAPGKSSFVLSDII